VPSRRFARPQGLSPPGTCQPCFMLVPPLGFALQGRYPLAEPIILSDAVPSRGWELSWFSVPAISGFQARRATWIFFDGVLLGLRPGGCNLSDSRRRSCQSSASSSGPCSLRASVSTRSVV
jgi:hypothetical protein